MLKKKSLSEKIPQFSQQFKKFFLLEFTKELIKNSSPKEVLELGITLKQQEKEKKQEIKEKLKEIQKPEKKLPILTKTIKSPILKRIFKSLPTSPKVKIPHRMPLRIPEIRLPPRLQYLRPYSTEIQLNLGKLNPLIKDSRIKSIECNGPNQSLIIKGQKFSQKTKIILTKEEINEILKTISTAAKIPLQEGIYRVVVGKIIFSAIISDVVENKFLIKKIENRSPYSFPRRRGRF